MHQCRNELGHWPSEDMCVPFEQSIELPPGHRSAILLARWTVHLPSWSIVKKAISPSSSKSWMFTRTPLYASHMRLTYWCHQVSCRCSPTASTTLLSGQEPVSSVTIIIVYGCSIDDRRHHTHQVSVGQKWPHHRGRELHAPICFAVSLISSRSRDWLFNWNNQAATISTVSFIGSSVAASSGHNR